MSTGSDLLGHAAILAVFVRGLAFFILGLVLLCASHRPGELGLVCDLRWLAAFGVLCSLASWLELSLLVPGSLGFATTPLEASRTLLLALAAMTLVVFGLLTLERQMSYPRWLHWVGAGLLAGWIVNAWLPALDSGANASSAWLAAGRWARLLLVLPGALLTAVALYAQRRQVTAAGPTGLAGLLAWGAAAFAGYGLAAGLVVSAGSLLPAFAVNDGSSFELMALVVELLQAALASALALFAFGLLATLNTGRRQAFDQCAAERGIARQAARAAASWARSAVAEWDCQIEGAVARRTTTLEQRTRELAALNSIALAVSRPAGLNEVLSGVLPRIVAALELDGGGVLVLRGAAQPGHTLVAQVGLPPDVPCLRTLIPDGDQLCAVGHRSDEPYSWESCARGGRPAGDTAVVPHGHLVIPIAVRGQVSVTLCLLTPPGCSLDLDRAGLLEGIRDQLSVAVANACLYEQIESMAVLEERERISREMHDGLAQVLGYLNLKSQAAQAALRTGEVRQAARNVRDIEQIAQAAYAEVREAILGLRTVVSPGTDLFVSLADYLRHFEREWRIEVRLVLPDGATPTFSPSVEIQLLRIVQEALANVRQHARARQTWVRFEVNRDTAQVTVEDNGLGFDPASVEPGHFGLATMRERAESVGGTFNLDTAPGLGTRVVVRLPLGPALVE